MKSTSQTARKHIVSAVGLALAIVSLCASAEEHEELEVAAGAAATTSARTAGSPEFDKAEKDAPPYRLDLVYKGDYLRATQGAAKKQDAYMGHLNVGLTIAGEKAFNLPGSTVYVNVMHNHGNQINELVNTQQGVDNIETPATSGRLYQLWWQQQFMDGKLSVLGGVYDLNTEFDVTESAGVFIHPAFGAGAELAQAGPSLFPTTGLGLRVRGEFTEQLYGQLAVLDAVPGHPGDNVGTHIHLSSREGAYWIGELGWRQGAGKDSEKALTKVALGAWRFGKKQDDPVLVDANNDPLKQTSAGYYVIGEQQLFGHDDGRRVMGFARYGVADQDANPIRDNLAVGITLEGPCSSRPDDVLGFGISKVRFSKKVQDDQINSGSQVMKSETAFELTYKAKVTDWLNIQPEMQYIKTSASNPTRDHDLVVGVRFEVSLGW